MRQYRDTNASVSSYLFSQPTNLHFTVTATRHGFTAAKQQQQQQKTSQVCSPVMQFSYPCRRSFTHKLGLLKALIDKTFTSHKEQNNLDGREIHNAPQTEINCLTVVLRKNAILDNFILKCISIVFNLKICTEVYATKQVGILHILFGVFN